LLAAPGCQINTGRLYSHGIITTIISASDLTNQTPSGSSFPRSSILAEQVLVAAALCLAAYGLLWTSILWFRYHPHLPWRDLFLLLDQVLDLEPASFTPTALLQWFEPHYAAHRIAIPRLLLWLDIHLLAGQNHTFFVAGWSCLLVLIMLYVKLARTHFRQSVTTMFVAALAAIWLFAPAHLWNLLNPINISWHLALTFSLLAFWVLIRCPQEPRWRDWCLAYLLCTLAAFCNFGGVIAWLLLPVLALMLHARVIVPTLLLSVILAWLYAGGISSDAEMATQWDLGSPEVIAQVQAQAHSVLAANTPSRIVVKTLQFLAWPLTESAPGLALLLSVLSVAVLAAVAIFGARSRWYPLSRLQAWTVFCMMVAGLCLGIALATQLGRLMEYPNHLHGPSYERYETVVVVYWLSISGLLLGLKPRLGRWAYLLLAMLLILAPSLQRPSGAYLSQEIESMESAGSLFITGERAALSGQRPKAGNRFIPEFVFTFDELFRDRQLAYRAPIELPAGLADVPQCTPTEVQVKAAAGQLIINVSLDLPEAWWSRSITLYRGNSMMGRLGPQHKGDFTPLSLLNPRLNSWQGTVPIGADSGTRELTLVLQQPLGTTVWCKLAVPPAR
jgi:hypothetical protein